MTTYQNILDRIAGHLVTHHGCPAEVSKEMAAKLVQDCGLSTILVSGLGARISGDTPRQIYGGEPTSL